MILEDYVLNRENLIIYDENLELIFEINKTIDYINKYTKIDTNRDNTINGGLKIILDFTRSIHKAIGLKDSRTKIVGCGRHLTKLIKDIQEKKDIHSLKFNIRILQRLIYTSYILKACNEETLEKIFEINKIKSGYEPESMTEDQYLKSSSLKLEIITDIINNRVRLEYFWMSI